MPLDEKAKKFLENAPVTQIAGTSAAASAKVVDAHAAYRQKEYMERTGSLYEELMGFYIEERRKRNELDDVCVGAIALFTINLRAAYGNPQTPEEEKTWTEIDRANKLAEFDSICVAMQNYYDANKDKP